MSRVRQTFVFERPNGYSYDPSTELQAMIRRAITKSGEQIFEGAGRFAFDGGEDGDFELQWDEPQSVLPSRLGAVVEEGLTGHSNHVLYLRELTSQTPWKRFEFRAGVGSGWREEGRCSDDQIRLALSRGAVVKSEGVPFS